MASNPGAPYGDQAAYSGQSQQSPQGPASAPSLESQYLVPGYENTSFHEEIVNPPVSPDWKGDERPERSDLSGIPSILEEEVRDAVLQHASDNCCYGKGPAQEMKFNEIKMSSAFHYTFQTFGEKRETAYCYVPYDGQPIDGPMNGPAPGPWDVVLLPNDYFANSKKKMEVPHTAFVKPCHDCGGSGRTRCSNCNGMGQKPCTWCNGTGRRFDSECTSCNFGNNRCTSCNAAGNVNCHTCNGRGNLKGFVQLTVTWANHYDDYISDEVNFPKEKIRSVSGRIVFEEENPRVWPLVSSGDPRVDQASNSMVTKHSQQFATERILKQRHCLRVIPIAQVNFGWKDRNGLFYVYGFENKVFFDDYPQKCCWGCTIS